MIADRPDRPGEVPSFRFPWAFWRRWGPRWAVLDALAEVGSAGMTPNSLEVSTELSEPRLNAVLRRLLDAGLIIRRPAGGVTALRSERYLLSTHARAHPHRFSGPGPHR